MYEDIRNVCLNQKLEASGKEWYAAFFFRPKQISRIRSHPITSSLGGRICSPRSRIVQTVHYGQYEYMARHNALQQSNDKYSDKMLFSASTQQNS
jgi:hypothetical protein